MRTAWTIGILITLVLLLPIALYFVPYFLFRTDESCRPPQSSGTAVNGREDDFASQIEKLCALVIAERETAIRDFQPNAGIMNDKFSYTVRMSASQLKRRMSELGFECRDMPKYNNRIGCGKKYQGYNHRYSIGITFDQSDGVISFYHGQSTTIRDDL